MDNIICFNVYSEETELTPDERIGANRKLHLAKATNTKGVVIEEFTIRYIHSAPNEKFGYVLQNEQGNVLYFGNRRLEIGQSNPLHIYAANMLFSADVFAARPFMIGENIGNVYDILLLTEQLEYSPDFHEYLRNKKCVMRPIDESIVRYRNTRYALQKIGTFFTLSALAFISKLFFDFLCQAIYENTC